MKMDAGLDTGPILARRSVEIRSGETAGELTDRLAVLGAELLTETLPAWMAGQVQATEQDDAAATYAPRISMVEAQLDWSSPAATLERVVRAMNPWPGAHTHHDGCRIKVHVAEALEAPDEDRAHGLVVESAAGPAVVTSEGLLLLREVQPAGGKRMSGADYARGRPGLIGSRLQEQEVEVGEA
jgi:methionyl-tRNA formyltransferase